jgi:hypothetical protein
LRQLERAELAFARAQGAAQEAQRTLEVLAGMYGAGVG